jgi:arsenite methyltransferase
MAAAKISTGRESPNYGVDAPAVLRNLLLGGVLCEVAAVLLPAWLNIGNLHLGIRPMFRGTGVFLLIQGLLYLLYVKWGKFRHRDLMLNMISWTGDEQVLDVGCGRGLLLAGAARRLTAKAAGAGFVTGIDVWSNVDMGGNSAEATMKNLRMEGVDSRCRLESVPAQEMTFANGAFDVVLSNLCLHNIEPLQAREEALRQIIRVLRPGGVAVISDYKNVRAYKRQFDASGFETTMRWGNLLNFPPLRVVEARKPL